MENATEYLAHLNRETGRSQTLHEHCSTVSVLAKKYGEDIGISSLAEIAGWLHDAGKAKQEFQEYLKSNNIAYRGKINHSTAGAKYLMETHEFRDNGDKFAKQIIALTILSHHSGLIDCIDTTGVDKFTDRMSPVADIHYPESIENFCASCISPDALSTLFQNATREAEITYKKIMGTNILPEEKLFYLGCMSRYLLSCLIDADRYDAYCFEAGIETKDPDYNVPEIWSELIGHLELYLTRYPHDTDIEILRSNISDSCKEFAQNPSGIYRLCVPTGGGKTLSSLRYALEHAKKFQKKRIIYTIPYTTIIDQNARVIRDALGHPDVILEHHSNIIRDEEEGDDGSGRSKSELLTERWDSPIILTTTVQLLNTLFLDKTRSIRRMHNLANSIIIFDEVQTIPIKCLSMFNTALNFLAEICGTTVILCTATQPELTAISHPLRLSVPSDMIDNLPELFRKFKRTNIVDARVDGGYTVDQVVDFALEKRTTNPSILIIANTTSSARKIYTSLQNRMPKEKLYYLSTKLCPAHRKEKLEEIRENLEEDIPMICVTTQLIEAGVDVSFCCVIRSVAGLDSIAQAAGRCNRHGESACKEVYVVNIAGEHLGRLPDILKGQDISLRVLGEFAKYPEIFGNDLLSPKAVEMYYQYYFLQRDREMNYVVSKSTSGFAETTNLYDLLTKNSLGVKVYYRKNGTSPPNSLVQAFASAGNHFTVIDQNQQAVIVPYGHGADIIRGLEQSRSFAETLYLIKAAQNYSVNLFSFEVDNLSNGVYPIGDTGAYALINACYTDEYGVTPVSDNEPVIL